ncbi:MAG TPA: hypothetical protein VMU88_04230, partial [bacterium]|nr:hypothetical protein [bacterium]
PRYLGLTTQLRLQYLNSSPWLLIPGAFLWLLGLLQALLLLVFWFKRQSPFADWTLMRRLILVNFLLVWASFWFTVKWPLAHIYYINFPLIFLYSLFVYRHFAARPEWKTFTRVYLAAAFLFQAAYAHKNYPQFSLYHDRAKVAQAIDQKNYLILGPRRPNSYY